jgi:hypothetical protein
VAVNYVFGGDPILAADMNRAINKKIAETVGVSDSGSITSEAVVDTVTADLVAGRTYKIRYVCPITTSSASGDRAFVRVRTGTTTGGTQLSFAGAKADNTAATDSDTAIVEATFTPSSSGSQSFCGTVQRTTANGNIVAKGATSQPRFLTVLADD